MRGEEFLDAIHADRRHPKRHGSFLKKYRIPQLSFSQLCDAAAQQPEATSASDTIMLIFKFDDYRAVIFGPPSVGNLFKDAWVMLVPVGASEVKSATAPN